MSQPKVSVIVPVYNVEKYLARCVNSLRNQSLTDIEIILVDDSSSDSSLALCNQFAKDDLRIKVIHKPNEGAGMARNAALAIATGKYIGFVDSDDYVARDMFKTLYEKAEQYHSDLVLSGVLYVGGIMFSEEGECVRKTYFEQDTQFESEEALKELRMGIVGALPKDPDDSKYGSSIWKNLFKHEIIKQNNLSFLSERKILSEDALFMIDYISCINRATGINEAFYYYCRNEASISKSYEKGRFEKTLAFVDAVETRFKKDIPQKEYQIYIGRFWQAMCRVMCAQEIMHASANRISYAVLKKRLQSVCTHSMTVRVLRSYPIHKLPPKQMVFAYGMKYRLYLLLKILVGLRSR